MPSPFVTVLLRSRFGPEGRVHLAFGDGNANAYRPHHFSRHLLDEDAEVCLRCRGYEYDALQGDIGSDVGAGGVNPPYYGELALTPVEQAIAKAVGLDPKGAMSLKVLTLLGGRRMSGADLIEARGQFERRAVEMKAALDSARGRGQRAG